MKSAIVPCLLAACCLTTLPIAAQQPSAVVKPRFETDTVVSTNEGHATLRWGLPDAAVAATSDLVFELQRSRDPEFDNLRVSHRGPESAYFVSGLLNGRNYFRVRAVPSGSAPGPWSDVLVVEVDYPGQDQVRLLLVVGCTVFVATVAAIVMGWLGTRRDRSVEDRAGA